MSVVAHVCWCESVGVWWVHVCVHSNVYVLYRCRCVSTWAAMCVYLCVRVAMFVPIRVCVYVCLVVYVCACVVSCVCVCMRAYYCVSMCNTSSVVTHKAQQRHCV
eukprot:GHVQ01010394.1.p2 GENE.GHVQ01010394.1~~GHVQ01010394.1.p2  ORF type:complete len:105 (-),score=16.62 GHVQ01010394.1:549-863(-)